MRRILSAAALAAVLGASALAADNGAAQPNVTAPVPAGTYTLDKAHASLLFKVSHIGFSNYTARFKRFDAQLQFDPEKLSASKLAATVDVKSLETDYPNPLELDFNAQLLGKEWFDAAQYPTMEYRSTRVEQTGPKSMRIHGDLTMHGVTKPVTLEATYNGGYASHPFEPNARVGFSAHGTLKRSDFGMSYGIPAPGTTMGVSDEVTIIIEAEFTGPPSKAASQQ
jgi:polyisoprenoid-binding protein YceI